MHEYSIVQALLTRVHQVAAAHRAEGVHRIHVCIGEGAGVEIDLLQLAFQTFREVGITRGAQLVVRQVPVRWTCPRCGAGIPAGTPLRCDACDQPARLTGGDEIHLERVELEVATSPNSAAGTKDREVSHV